MMVGIGAVPAPNAAHVVHVSGVAVEAQHAAAWYWVVAPVPITQNTWLGGCPLPASQKFMELVPLQ